MKKTFIELHIKGVPFILHTGEICAVFIQDREKDSCRIDLDSQEIFPDESYAQVRVLLIEK